MTPERERIGPVRPRPPIGASFGGRAHSHGTASDVRDQESACVRSIAGLSADDHVQFEDEGWDSRVYVVNRGEVVFKFPRTASAQGAYANEIAIMRLLDGGDDRVRVPVVQWVGPDLSYFGYRGIVGHQLGRVMESVSHTDRARIGSDLGAFLAGLHALVLPNVRVVTVEDEIEEFVRKFASARTAIEDEFTATERSGLDHFFGARLPGTMRALGGEPVTCHGDLGAYNVMVGDDGRVGMIDFGDLGIIDKSKDFIGFEDPAMLSAALDAHGASEQLREKVAIRALALPALDLPFYLGKGDAAGVAHCIDRLRAIVI